MNSKEQRVAFERRRSYSNEIDWKFMKGQKINDYDLF